MLVQTYSIALIGGINAVIMPQQRPLPRRHGGCLVSCFMCTLNLAWAVVVPSCSQAGLLQPAGDKSVKCIFAAPPKRTKAVLDNKNVGCHGHVVVTQGNWALHSPQRGSFIAAQLAGLVRSLAGCLLGVQRVTGRGPS